MCVRFKVFMAVTRKNAVFWDVTPCGSCKTDVLEEHSASIIRVTRIGEFLVHRFFITSQKRGIHQVDVFVFLPSAGTDLLLERGKLCIE
jgi:hypothetical protein